MRRVLVVLGMSALISGQALASPALTLSPTIMRASPSPRARVVQAIPNNTQIDLNYCGKAWCYVSWRNLFGYVSAKSVVALPEAPPPAVVYGPPPSSWLRIMAGVGIMAGAGGSGRDLALRAGTWLWQGRAGGSAAETCSR